MDFLPSVKLLNSCILVMQNLDEINTLITFLSPLQKEQVKPQLCCKK